MELNSLFNRLYLRCITFSLLMFSYNICNSQSIIKVLNIPIGQGENPRGGLYKNTINYTLLQSFLKDHATPKLLNTRNFGPNGVVKNSLSIKNGFENLGSIVTLNQLDEFDIIFIGSIGDEKNTYLKSEMDLMLLWSSKPGNVLIVAEQPAGFPFSSHRKLFLKGTTSTNPSQPWQYFNDQLPNIHSGPFGKVSSINQNGTSQGYFDSYCDAVGLFWGINNKPTVLYDYIYNDIYISDTDFFSYLNPDMRFNNLISSQSEIAWGNLWAWAISEVIQPKMKPKIP